jgi:tetratricopeptide (TPR) repeat protein
MKPLPLTGPPAARLEEAKALINRGDHAGAVRILLELRRTSDHPDVALNLARARMAAGEWSAARTHFEEVLAVAPDVDFAYLMIARTHQREDDVPAAIAATERLLHLHPAHVNALVMKAELLHLLGRWDEGRQLLQPLFDQKLRDPGVLFEHGRLCAALGDDEAAERSLSASFNAVPDRAPAAERRRHQAQCMYELAAVYERRGEYERAWKAAADANSLQPRPFDPDAHDAMIDRVIAAWTPEAFAAIPVAKSTDELPVFVLGMPRSGTSLVEQILASHPQVHAGGERSRMHKIIRGLEDHDDALAARIEGPPSLTQAGLDRGAKEYLKELRGLSRSATRVTDKQPFNFLYVGVIARMLPGARILHCTRHPMDVAVSCFFQSFMGTIWFANDLEHIGRFQAAYRRLMDHWAMLLAGDPHGSGARMLDVPYEELTADQDTWSRRIIEHAGLPWDDACLRFHEAERVTHTASADQVRRPMYRTSVERWRRYETQLLPIMGDAAGG